MTLRPILTRRKLTLLALVAVAVVAAFLIVGQLRAAHGVASGGSPAARALLERELARLPDNHIVSAEFTSPRPDEIATGAPNKSDNWLNIDARAASHADAIVADWQAALLLAAFSQSAQTAGVNRLDGAQLQIRDGSGQIIDRNDFDLGDPALAAPDIIETDHAAAEARMRTSFENGAASANARLVRATFVELPDLSAGSRPIAWCRSASDGAGE
jgi:hypothetical protein